jgi:hypothetical protein
LKEGQFSQFFVALQLLHHAMHAHDH